MNDEQHTTTGQTLVWSAGGTPHARARAIYQGGWPRQQARLSRQDMGKPLLDDLTPGRMESIARTRAAELPPTFLSLPRC